VTVLVVVGAVVEIFARKTQRVGKAKEAQKAGEVKEAQEVGEVREVQKHKGSP
jgi:hypothetical protein